MIFVADGGDQVCQQTSDLAEGERDDFVSSGIAAPFDAAAVTARNAWAHLARVMWRYQAS